MFNKNKIIIKLEGEVYLNGRNIIDIESDGRYYVSSNFYTKEEMESFVEVFDKIKNLPKVEIK